jgi:hypothetical protein
MFFPFMPKWIYGTVTLPTCVRLVAPSKEGYAFFSQAQVMTMVEAHLCTFAILIEDIFALMRSLTGYDSLY